MDERYQHRRERFLNRHELIGIIWEGENFHYRYVNVIPRCYQQPRPPMWLTTYRQQIHRSLNLETRI
jgi:hypothetical protein